MGSGPPLVPGASTSLQTILDNHRPASPTNAPAAQFFGPHVACHVREGRFLIAGAPMLRREQSGKSRALQGGRLSRRRSRILGSGRLGAESGAAGEEGQQQASVHLCWLAGHTHSPAACRQHLLGSKYHILGHTLNLCAQSSD